MRTTYQCTNMKKQNPLSVTSLGAILFLVLVRRKRHQIRNTSPNTKYVIKHEIRHQNMKLNTKYAIKHEIHHQNTKHVRRSRGNERSLR